ncbi:Prenylcysteine lyase-domain-containing protein [Pisolithus orientalis]|uniref:Prenylcysteine lyase-domain-containing protein n=1 Tax=Pisolithus orientalis TaxID=936130 RepID=UPI002223FC8A|nr:Prenylcysteine lyase-domain-containing protein [Pisolithus orientalis]KAI6005036.1 Prenylcysteine lyase-domain-containing protein [Pisolithus orientalis]
MSSLTKVAVYSLLATSAVCLQFPFKLPFFKQKVDVLTDNQVAPQVTPRIAIVGAGAAGSSAAFWISKAKERFGIDVEIDVYERASYIGGRSTIVYPYNDTTLAPMELGASIFVDANKNLMRAAKEFNLTLKDFIDEFSDTGLWDGQKFDIVLNEGTYTKSWWTTLKVLWRYGYSAPVKTQSIVKNMIAEYLSLYTATSHRWDGIADLVEKMNWTDFVNSTTLEYLSSKGVAEKWSREMVEAATRVNYGQDVDKIHALEGTCSLAATGASGVRDGNFLIFENFLKHSGANVYLNTEVRDILRVPGSSRWILHTSSGSRIYKAVILAAPFHQTNISVASDLAELIPPQPYVHLHVTLLTTRSESTNPTYFGLSPGEKVPKVILTTHEGARAGGVEPEFNSISVHGRIQRAPGSADEKPEWKVKIFSKERITDEWLEKVFGHVGWVYRKEWDAYPVLPPTTKFPPMRLEQGFYYVNAFEPFISTMETETIASRNVVDLLLHEEFGSGICGSQLSGPETSEGNPGHDGGSEDFVLGWDC